MDLATLEHFKTLFQEILAEEEGPETLMQPVTLEGDEVDMVSIEKLNQMDFRLRARNTIYLKKVKRSLQKIEDGTFGDCEECEGEISLSRLKARPTADLCIGCKEMEEKEEKQLIHGNRTSVKTGRVLPIEHLEKGYNQDETATTGHKVTHMDYQDIVG